MSIFTKIIEVIGQLFAGLFRSAKKAYEQLPPETKDAMVHGAGVIDLINSMLDATPKQIGDAIKTKFPKLDQQDLEKGLVSLAHMFNLLPKSNGLEDLVRSLQGYLKAHTGKTWETVSHSLGVALSGIFAPGEKKIASFTLLIEFVYRTFIKKHDK